eukprot:TRINITY_DN454_c3_g1_i1.p1 TRINITY_DN454_c3_g1~~TRINITY_DN454_c3_g1_i1.p1  ORF type:complete len:500 (-),score=223.88 TRINITY_DN454_c3_g1_i1:73-1518(-)
MILQIILILICSIILFGLIGFYLVKKSFTITIETEELIEPTKTKSLLFKLKVYLTTKIVEFGRNKNSKKRKPKEIESLQKKTIEPEIDTTLPEFTDNHYFLCQSNDNQSIIWTRLGWRSQVIETNLWIINSTIGNMLTLSENSNTALSSKTFKNSMKGSFFKVPIFKRPKSLNFHNENDKDKDNDKDNDNEFVFNQSIKGLQLNCIDPLKKWKINYEGPLIGENVIVEVKLSLEFDATTKPFYFDRNSNIKTISTLLAKNKYTSSFFKDLQTLDQKRYEQIGRISGKIQYLKTFSTNHSLVTGVWNDLIIDSTNSIRARTYGPRNWEHFERWTYHIGTFPDGRAFHFTAIRRKQLKLLIAGYFFDEKNKKIAIVSGSSLIAFGKFAKRDYEFNFKPHGLSRHFINVSINTAMSSATQYGSSDDNQGSAILLQNYATIHLTTKKDSNKVQGVAYCEWGYRLSEYEKPDWLENRENKKIKKSN